MTRRTGFLAMLFGTAIAASSWLAYHHGGEPSRGKRAKRLKRVVDPIVRRADREAAEGTEYPAAWGPRRVA